MAGEGRFRLARLPLSPLPGTPSPFLGSTSSPTTTATGVQGGPATSLATPEKVQGLDSQTFLTALATNGGILFVELAAFVILKHRLSRIYEPWAYLPPPEFVVSPACVRCTDAVCAGNGPPTCWVGHGSGCWRL